MRNRLEFQVNWESGHVGPPEEVATFGRLLLRVDDDEVLRVLDVAARTVRPDIRVSVYPLVVWLVENWWRLRWEPGPPKASHEWRMAHFMGAAGGGYAWPNIRFESEGADVRISMRRSTESRATIEYLMSKYWHISGSDFESAIDRLVRMTVSRLGALGCGDQLIEAWSLIQEERADQDLRFIRRVEASQGFEPESLSEEEAQTLIQRRDDLGEDATYELAAAHADVWDDLDTVREGAEFEVPSFEDLRREVANVGPSRFPWELGETAAKAVRNQLGACRGAIGSTDLRSLFEKESVGNLGVAIGIRDSADNSTFRAVLKNQRYEENRRFEIARLLCEHLLTANRTDRVLAVTDCPTTRQKIQRAFAAELLMPIEDLQAAFDDGVDEDRVHEIAEEFTVSPVLVESRLKNKNLLFRR